MILPEGGAKHSSAWLNIEGTVILGLAKLEPFLCGGVTLMLNARVCGLGTNLVLIFSSFLFIIVEKKYIKKDIWKNNIDDRTQVSVCTVFVCKSGLNTRSLGLNISPIIISSLVTVCPCQHFHLENFKGTSIYSLIRKTGNL